MLAIFAIAPLVVAAFIAMLISDHPKSIKYIALGASLLSLMLVILSSFTNAISAINWFSVSGYTFSLLISTMHLNMLLLFIVAIMTPLIIAYSIGFMDVPSEQGRYYFELCLFAASMMLFAMAADFLTMLIGWELLGITSYLLIGFWYKKDAAPRAARKAITTVLIGDMLMLAAILILWSVYHTFNFSLISLLTITQSNASAEVAMILIMIAAFTKSAQFPFQEWLPDAMEGPTPVSAFLHSSTMVKAGVFLSVIMLPMFASYNLLNILLVIGIITAIVGATNALAESQIKRILAYSTIEDLGLMFIALGLNAVIAALLLFVVQTFYKALLFMSAGAIMKANNNEEEIDRIRTSSAGKPLLIAILIGVLSIAGILPLGGFFGKTAIEAAANMPVYIILVAISLVSSVYIFRWFLLPLRKSAAARTDEVADFRFMPQSMLIPIYIMAALAVLSSVAYIYLPGYLASYGNATVSIAPMGAAVETIAVVVGLILAYLLYFRRKKTQATNGLIHALLYNGVFVNQAYLLITKLFGLIAYAADMVDYELYKFIRSTGRGVTGFAGLLKRIENGQTNAYIIAFLLGIVAIIILVIVVP